MNCPSLLNILSVILIPLGDSGLFDIISQIIKFLQSNNDITSQVVVVLTIIPVLLRLLEAIYEFRKKNKKKSIEITVNIDGKPISISANDPERAAELASRFQQLHPEVAQKVKVRVRVPKKRRRTKR